MPTSFEVIFLGTLPRIDLVQGDEVSENAAAILGTYGSTASPLSAQIRTLSANSLSEDDNSTYDVDNGGGYDSFRINGGAAQNFDGWAIYNAVITYSDGSTATITAVVVQDVSGNTYLVPEDASTTDQIALTTRSITSLALQSVVANSGELPADRVAGDFKSPVDGTAGNDLMGVGFADAQGDQISNANDDILAGAGNDTVNGGGGTDFINAGDGADSVEGGTGNDRALGGTGNDTLSGSAGNDILEGEAGDDTLLGGNNNDLLYGGSGNDSLSGGTGDDQLFGDAGNDRLDGGAGQDSLFGGDGDDTIILNDGFGSAALGVGSTITTAITSVAQNGSGNQSAPVIVTLDNGNVLYVWGDNALGDTTANLLHGRMYDAAGAPISDQFRIGNYAYDGSDGSFASVPGLSVTVMANGNVAVGYASLSTTAGIGQAPVMTILDGDLLPGQTGFVVAEDVLIQQSDTTTGESAPILTALGDGRLLAVYTKGAQGDSQILTGRIFNADGTPSTGDFAIGTARVDATTFGLFEHNVYVQQLTGGNVVIGIAKENFDTSAGVGGTLYQPVINIIDPDFAPGAPGFAVLSNAPVRTMDNDGLFESAPRIVALDDGGFMTVWYDQVGADDVANRTIIGRIWNADGTSRTGQFDIGTSAIDGFGTYTVPILSAETLDNGNVLIGWVRSTVSTAGQNDPMMTIINPTATPGSPGFTVLPEFQINQVPGIIYSGSPIFAELGNGAFVAVWHDGGGYADDHVYYRIFDENGLPLGDEVRITSTTGQLFDAGQGANWSTLYVEATGPASFSIGWMGNDTSTLDGSGTSVLTTSVTVPNSLLGLPSTATGLIDSYVGGEGAETTGDTLDLSGLSGAATVAFTADDVGTITVGTDTAEFREFERVIATAQADTVDGTTANAAIVVSGGGGADTITGGGGNDLIYGGTGTDSLIGGAGNDTLFGEDGADRLFGGIGADSLLGGLANDTLAGGADNDTLAGEAGDDSLTGDAGNDVFVIGSGNDTITDFGAGGTSITDGDITNNDLVDLSGFYSLANYNAAVAAGRIDGNVIKNPLQWLRADQADGILNDSDAGWDATRSLRLQRDGVAVDGSAITFDTTNVICFTRGTLIRTPRGDVAVENLRPGDLVDTLDGPPRAIRWIGHRHLDGETLARLPRLRPVRIRAGSLAPGLPVRDLTVSPQHRLLLRSVVARRMFDADEVLVAARHLVDDAQVTEVAAPDGVEYWHFLCDQHEVVLANGTPSESLFTGAEALRAVGPDAAAEIAALFPELGSAEMLVTRAPARPLIAGKKARALAARIRRNGKPLVETQALRSTCAA